MKIFKFKIKGLLKIKPDLYKDNRGYFFESYHSIKYNKFIKDKFIQDDHSYSKKNVLRGIHFQYKNPQSQLFYLVTGKIFLVTVDFRPKSKTFLQYQSFNLSSKFHEQIFTPPGVGCGFYSFTNDVHLVYKISKVYKINTEMGVIWNDKQLKIKWPCKRPVLSKKDKSYLSINRIDFQKLIDLNKL